MNETNDPAVVENPKQSLRARFATKKNAKRVGIAAVVVGALVWLKSKLNANGSVSADVHVETSDETDNN